MNESIKDIYAAKAWNIERGNWREFERLLKVEKFQKMAIDIDFKNKSEVAKC